MRSYRKTIPNIEVFIAMLAMIISIRLNARTTIITKAII